MGRRTCEDQRQCQLVLHLVVSQRMEKIPQTSIANGIQIQIEEGDRLNVGQVQTEHAGREWRLRCSFPVRRSDAELLPRRSGCSRSRSQSVSAMELEIPNGTSSGNGRFT